jgi:uncharacterized protein (TIGR02145 family)
MRSHISLHQAYTYKPVYTANNPLFLLAFLLVLLPTWVSAQITGRVVDTAGNNLEGVAISTLHDGANTVSGADGSFSLEFLDDPVGALAHSAQISAAPSMSGVRLQRSLESGQMPFVKTEVHTPRGVFDLQGKFLRVAESAGAHSHGGEGALRKALAQADTLVFVKSGYLTARVEITDDVVDLGDVVLEEAIGSFTDTRDGKVYRTVTIGTQTWMAENLNYSGDDGAGNKTFDIGWCYGVAESDTSIHTDSTTCDTFGRLYTWDMVMDGATSSDANPSAVQGICPEGWHVPSDGEWTELTDYVIANTAGTSTSEIAPYLKAISGWNSGGNGTDDFGFNGTDDFGFSALPGGYRSYNGRFYAQGIGGYWWSATENYSGSAWYRYMYYIYEYVKRYNYYKDDGYSLRCLANTIPTISASHVSLEYPVIGEPVSFTADTRLVFNEPSVAAVTWSVNGGAFGSDGIDFTYVPTEAGRDTVIAKVEQNGVSSFDTVYVMVYGTFTDNRDNQEYIYSTIGTQTWMAENLNYNAGAGSYCYDDDPANCDTYGRLYTWEAAMAGAASSSTTPSGVQGVCPDEWHLPSDDEWTILSDYVIANSAGTSTSNIGPYLKRPLGGILILESLLMITLVSPAFPGATGSSMAATTMWATPATGGRLQRVVAPMRTSGPSTTATTSSSGTTHP